MSKLLPRSLLALLLLSLSALAIAKDSRMAPADAPSDAAADTAVIVFLRPSQVGGAIKSSDAAGRRDLRHTHDLVLAHSTRKVE